MREGLSGCCLRKDWQICRIYHLASVFSVFVPPMDFLKKSGGIWRAVGAVIVDPICQRPQFALFLRMKNARMMAIVIVTPTAEKA